MVIRNSFTRTIEHTSKLGSASVCQTEALPQTTTAESLRDDLINQMKVRAIGGSRGNNNTLTCPSQYHSGEHREKSETSQRQPVDCTEPQKLTPLSPHASHPFSGVLPRKIQ